MLFISILYECSMQYLCLFLENVIYKYIDELVRERVVSNV